MSEDIREQVVTSTKACPIKISLQVDKSTDVPHCHQILKNLSIFFCESLKISKTKDPIDVIKYFFTKHQPDLHRIDSIFIDAAPVGRPLQF